MAGLNYDISLGHLIINGIDMHNRAFTILDPMPLWGFDVPVRGSNVVVPGVAGTLAQVIRVDEVHYALAMAITGQADISGNPATDKKEQLQDNIDYLRVNVVNPPLTATVPAYLVMPDSATRYADIQVLGLHLLSHISAELVAAELDICIPSGGFTEVIGS
jgi:hypothetical protein